MLSRLRNELRTAALPVILAQLALTGCTGEPSDQGPDEPRSGQPESPQTAAQATTRETTGSPSPSGTAASQGEIPERLRTCAGCHFGIVSSWLDHGMAGSVGSLAQAASLPEPGSVSNPISGWRYEISVHSGEGWLLGVSPDGGRREQRLVGRLGAGVFDVSWVGEEIDPTTGSGTGRLFFAPVETITGHGLALSPFELHEGSAGMDMALTGDCLTCHTTDRVTGLPDASVAANRRTVYPGNALGTGAFHHLDRIGCDACHGDTSRHRAIATGESEPGAGEGLGIRRMATLSAAEKRDVCARCHLQGDVRSELLSGMDDGAPHRNRPLAGQIPVLVPAREQEDFRFVGQTEQLALSLCFRSSLRMTCTTCHDPHTAVRSQGPASFDAACVSCHGGDREAGSGSAGNHCSRGPGLTVGDVAGRPARTEAGCVDCHLRRAQPVDLPHIETTDHRVRRRLPPPDESSPEGPHGLPAHRGVLDREGPLRLYVDPHDQRLTAALSSPAGKIWRRGVEAMGMVSLGRLEDARKGFARFPDPGSPEARRPTAPEPLVPLETEPLFHHLRAVVLQASGRFEQALAAYDDALALDPERAEARMGRAQLRFRLGDLQGMVTDTEEVIRAHPAAEAPWLLRAELALQLQRPDMALQALESSAARWPSNPQVWVQIARLRSATGRPDAGEAEARAEALAPGVVAP